MPKFEYKILEGGFPCEYLTEYKMNRTGEEGWELVTVTINRNNDKNKVDVVGYFKREIKET